LGKVDALSTAALSVVIIFLLPKPLNIASSYFIVDGLIDNLDTYIEDSDFIMAELLNILQLLNNDHFII